MLFQHFRFLAPPSPHIYPSHLPFKAFRLHFSFSNHFVSWFFWNCAPRCSRNNNSENRQSIFNEKSYFFDLETAQIKLVSVMVFGLIALSFAPLPFYPPPASQAGPQKPSQICVLLLQVASLGDFTDICDDIVTTFWRIRCHFDDILAYHAPFWHNFDENPSLEASKPRSL